MRLIGHLPNESSASTFSDYLYVQGITNEVEAENDRWAVWIHSEDELEKARDLLTVYLGNPADPKFRKEAGQIREIRQKEAAEEARVEARILDRTKVFRSSMPYGVGALTAVLIGLCLVVHILRLGGFDEAIHRELLISAVEMENDRANFRTGLLEVQQGEFWRLFTPVMVHGNWLHLLLNMMWLLDLGSMIEGRQSTGRLGLLTVLIGVASNLGQFWFTGNPAFYGMSGVVYGLLGYVWMKGKYDPSSGLYLHPHTVAMMLIWFVVCFTGKVGPIANYAHAVGLGMGVAWGFLASLPARRRQA